MKHLFSLLVCTVLASAPASTQDTSLTILRAKTLQRLEQIVESAGGTIGVAAIDLTSGEWFTLNETFVFPQASAIKIPILMEVYRQADEGKAPVRGPFPSIPW